MAKCAVLTLMRNEDFHLPHWITYYSKHFAPGDMYILDQQSDTPKTLETLARAGASGINVITASNGKEIFDHGWLVKKVETAQRKLLKKYEYVLVADADEFVVPRTGTLKNFIARASHDAYRCIRYEIKGGEMYQDPMYSKTLLAKVPLSWGYGMHNAKPQIDPGGSLYLYHTRKLDYGATFAKNQRWRKGKWNREAVEHKYGSQSQLFDKASFDEWYSDTANRPLKPIHQRMKRIISEF